MAIKMHRDQLKKIVFEELRRYLAEELNEAPPSKGTILDDEPEEDLPPEDDIPNPGQAPEEALPSDSPAPEAGDEPGDVPDLEGDETEMDQDLDAIEAGEEPPSEDEEGTLAGELKNKAIEKVTLDEDSKIMPGATELVFTFRESADAFRVMITKGGKVKFFYRGLHNSLDSQISPMPGDDAPEEMDDTGEDLEDMEPLGDEDMPPEPPPEEGEPLPPEEEPV